MWDSTLGGLPLTLAFVVALHRYIDMDDVCLDENVTFLLGVLYVIRVRYEKMKLVHINACNSSLGCSGFACSLGRSFKIRNLFLITALNCRMWRINWKPPILLRNTNEK